MTGVTLGCLFVKMYFHLWLSMFCVHQVYVIMITELSVILQTLCLSAAVLFYVMTRDKLNTEWDNSGAGEHVCFLQGLLVGGGRYCAHDASNNYCNQPNTFT